LHKENVAKMPTEFLVNTFNQQLNDESIRFTIMASLGKANESDTDPSQ
jgi:catalase